MAPLVDRITNLEPEYRALSDAQLQAKTALFKERLDADEPLEDLLPEAFATAREASARVLGMRPFDVQVIGGIVLHQGKIAEMKTGEGKTLVATMPAYLNALTGRGVHIVTVNDYLARRDAHWMGGIYRFLGLTVDTIVHGLDDNERRQAYAADITYGTNNEFGFDYLRDNMKFSLEDYVQRDFHYAIVDEVDSILVDEARTPLIISGPAEESTQLYYTLNQVSKQLKQDQDFTVDEKARSVIITEEGVAHAEKLVNLPNLYDPRNIEVLHHLNAALKAHNLFKRDVDYIVKEGQVLIVDEFTGRLMPGRRYSDGLHQALEAKEGVKIENENQTLATITFQNFFRMYDKLAGMTGTADTEAEEFKKIYNLEVMIIPTDQKMIRTDYPDAIYRTEAEKYTAVVADITDCYQRGQPVLVGTTSIEKSEHVSRLLKKEGIKHEVLNAKQHEKEAQIVAHAGQMGRVTIATNMAGRGTDIVLGEGVVERGGLHILATERHESRRIDNQLRGRSGRQGDPGTSRFYLSLEDDLLRIFGSDRIKGLMGRLGMDDGEPIEHRLVSNAIEKAQKRVEGHNFDIRKHLLEYDDVMNKQREVIYSQRRQILSGITLEEDLMDMAAELVEEIVEEYTANKMPEEWDLKAWGTPPTGSSASGSPWKTWTATWTMTSTTSSSTWWKSASPPSATRSAPNSLRSCSRWSCSRSWTTTGKTTSCPWTTCGTASGSGATPRLTPCGNTSGKAMRCFMDLIHRIKADSVGTLFHLQVKPHHEPPPEARPAQTAHGVQPRRRQRRPAQGAPEEKGGPQRPLHLRQRQEI